jgi:hypothetical protein
MKLVKGEGSKETGACWMSAIAWYEGNSNWTDAPDCVCPIIRELAIWVNDRIDSNEERERLISPIMFSVVGTANPALFLSRRQKVVAFAAAKARSVLHLVPTEFADVSRKAIGAAEAWVENPSEENRNATRAASIAAHAATNDAYATSFAAAYAASAAAYAASHATNAAAHAAQRAAFAAANAAYATIDAAYAANHAARASRSDAINEVINLILELAAMGEKREVAQVRNLQELP